MFPGCPERWNVEGTFSEYSRNITWRQAKTQEMCGIKQLINVILYLVLFLINIKLKKICDIVVSLYPFLIVHYPDKYKTQKMCDEAVDDYLAALKSISDWFFTKKSLKNLITISMPMMIHSFTMKILIKSHILLIKNILLLQILKN